MSSRVLRAAALLLLAALALFLPAACRTVEPAPPLERLSVSELRLELDERLAWCRVQALELPWTLDEPLRSYRAGEYTEPRDLRSVLLGLRGAMRDHEKAFLRSRQP